MRQLLEQVATGDGVNYNNQIQTDLAMECASFVGYMECVSDMIELDVVSEGIDFKVIFNKLSEFGKIIYNKAIKIIDGLVNFVQSKILKHNNRTNNSSINEKILGSNEFDEKIGELIADYEGYIGPSYKSIINAQNLLNQGASVALDLASEINNEIERMYSSVSDKGGRASFEINSVKRLSLSDKFDKLMSDKYSTLNSMLNNTYWRRVETPVDLKDFIDTIYTIGLSNDKYDDEVRMTTDEFKENLGMKFSDDENKIFVKRLKEKKKEYLDSANKCKRHLDELASVRGFKDPIEATRHSHYSEFIKVTNEKLNFLVNVITWATSEYIEKSMSLLGYSDTLDKYINNIVKNL